MPEVVPYIPLVITVVVVLIALWSLGRAHQSAAKHMPDTRQQESEHVRSLAKRVEELDLEVSDLRDLYNRVNGRIKAMTGRRANDGRGNSQQDDPEPDSTKYPAAWAEWYKRNNPDWLERAKRGG